MPAWDVQFGLKVDLADEELLKAIYQAQALARVIHEIPLPPATRAQLNRMNIIRAVRGTTGIEGSDLTEEEVRDVLESPDAGPVLPRARQREEKEVRNASEVMTFVQKALIESPDEPLTEDLICRLHKLTTEGIPYNDNVPGQYRTHAVTVLEYVPPRESHHVRRLMGEFVHWLNRPPVTNWPPVVRAVAAHFYFISIHPFGDGNGRTARGIESYLLFQARINRLGFFSLANFYYRKRAEYVEMLDFVRFSSGGDLTPFIRFAAQGLLEELELIASEVLLANKKVAFRDYVNDTLGGAQSIRKETTVRLVRAMHGFMQVPEVSEAELRSGRHILSGLYRGVSAKTLSRDLAMLEARDLIVRSGGVIRINLSLMEKYTTSDMASMD